MKLQKKLTRKEWEEVIALGPGIHNFRRKKTLIYNGKKFWKVTRDENTGKCNFEVQDTVEVIIILPGVKIIRGSRFYGFNVKTVIMADTVRRIEKHAFHTCMNLRFIRLSRNIEYIGSKAFSYCELLTSIFIPASCREIGDKAFYSCNKLLILNVSQNTTLGQNVTHYSALYRVSPYFETQHEYIEWIKNVNIGNDLHGECASCNPSEERIYAIFKHQGRKYFQLENNIGVTASRYLNENPFTDLNEQTLINRRVLDMMGEIIT